MSVEEMSLVYNLIFIGILMVVCGAFSVVHLLLRNKLNLNYWLLTTLLFVAICFITIFTWHYTIGFI
jgi:uncharacterized membrane protein HdeD (DUF308 family)